MDATSNRPVEIARSEGTAMWGGLSFGYFSLAAQRKVPRQPGETGHLVRRTTNKITNNENSQAETRKPTAD
ncbi:hypothetical protein [Aurantivibrio infirmus]